MCDSLRTCADGAGEGPRADNGRLFLLLGPAEHGGVELFESTLPELSGSIFQVALPRFPPTSKEHAASLTRELWGVVYRPPPPLEPVDGREQAALAAPHLAALVVESRRLAEEWGAIWPTRFREPRGPNVALILDPDTGACVAWGRHPGRPCCIGTGSSDSSRRSAIEGGAEWTWAANPLRHAVVDAISSVAAAQVRGGAAGGGDGALAHVSTAPTAAPVMLPALAAAHAGRKRPRPREASGRGETAASPAPASASAPASAYLCTGLDMLVVREPCAMCATTLPACPATGSLPPGFAPSGAQWL